MTTNINDVLIEIKENNHDEIRSQFIQEYIPFIVKTVSEMTGKYIKINSSEEFAIALEAFDEAINRYDFGRGKFLDFSKLVIQSRLKDYFRQLKKQNIFVNNTLLQAQSQEDLERDFLLKNEIESFKNELMSYDITFERLIENVPVHQKTKMVAIEIAKMIAMDPTMLMNLRQTKQLQRKEINFKMGVTNKQLKRSRCYIIAVVIVLSGDYDEIQQFLSI